MKVYLIIIFGLLIILSGSVFYRSIKNYIEYVYCLIENNKDIRFEDLSSFQIEGTILKDNVRERPYDRLPVEFKNKVSKQVWNHSMSSAGVAISFRTNSSEIWAKWVVEKNHEKPHMTDLGIKGIDLYVKKEGKWFFLNSGIPSGKRNCKLLAKTNHDKSYEYKIYLPLFDRLKSIQIGVGSRSRLEGIPSGKSKSILFYGTSITQGACVTRPGLAYTNQISRELSKECINLGFSANGKMEIEIAKIIVQADPTFVVIDCLPNMDTILLKKRLAPFIKLVNENFTDVPIILVEWFADRCIQLEEKKISKIAKMNAFLKEEYNDVFIKEYKNIHYIDFEDVNQRDCEKWTIDQVHLNDYGSMQYSAYLMNKFMEFNLIEKEREE